VRIGVFNGPNTHPLTLLMTEPVNLLVHGTFLHKNPFIYEINYKC